MKLFKVELTYTLMVAAETQAQAEMQAERSVGSDGADAEDAHAIEVTKVEDVPSEWIDCIPFGGKGDTDDSTCRERLTDGVTAARREF